jgi:2-oxoglutarate ferredoxin oxidoreductase subunit gamma
VLERILIAGSGGQGVILIGRLLANCALGAVPHLTFFPAYGAEVRGGTSNCQVVLSSEEISSPVSESFDSMIVLNRASAERFRPRMTGACLVLLNRSLCDPPDVPSPMAAIPATEMAAELGNPRVANVVMLGAYGARKPLLPRGKLEDGIRAALASKGADLVELNLRAFDAGWNASET